MPLQQTIEVDHLTKRFGKNKAVNNISFTVNKGEVVGFVGPNGAGKTTTISTLLGFIRPTEGNVKLLGGEEIRPETAHKSHKKIGYVAGDMALFDNLTGAQYLAFMASQLGKDTKVRTRLDDRLSPQLNKRLKRLSRGNKQKIALIAALQHNPELIILDEPTSGLDPLMQETFLDIIREEAARGATVFMSSHILSEVAKACDRVMFMKQGQIVIDQPIREVEANAGKIIQLRGTRQEIEMLKRALPKGASLLEDGATLISLRYDGQIHDAVAWLSGKHYKDLIIEDRQLDDIFSDLYHDERGAQ